MRIHLKPASNIRVHQRRFHGKYGSRGRSELIPKPSRICEDRLGGTCEGRPCLSLFAEIVQGRARIATAVKGRRFLETRFIKVRMGNLVLNGKSGRILP